MPAIRLLVALRDPRDIFSWRSEVGKFGGGSFARGIVNPLVHRGLSFGANVAHAHTDERRNSARMTYVRACLCAGGNGERCSGVPFSRRHASVVRFYALKFLPSRERNTPFALACFSQRAAVTSAAIISAGGDKFYASRFRATLSPAACVPGCVCIYICVYVSRF